MTMSRDQEQQRLRWISQAIATRGQAVLCVGSGACSVPGCDCPPEAVPWSYTIGLVERDHPEIVALGLPPGAATAVLNWVHDCDAAGERMTIGQVGRFRGAAVKLLPVPRSWVASDADPMAAWFDYYGVDQRCGDPPDALQLVWSDRHGNFPGPPGCARGVVALQPLLVDQPRWQPGRPNRATRRGRRLWR